MLPIRGDIAMNRILYPDDEVQNSYTQLNNILAPNGHPSINGVGVSAYHPVAINTHNYGGFIRNPSKKGKRVFTDLVINEELAGKSVDGKETVRRIEAGEKIGVSTGLTIANVERTSGVDDFGKPYDMIGRGFQFDHVATLLNEEAAGAHAGTEVIVNSESGEEAVYVNELVANNLTTDELHQAVREAVRAEAGAGENVFVWINDIFLDPLSVVYSIDSNGNEDTFRRSFSIDDMGAVELVGEAVEVVRRVDYVTLEDATNPTKPTESDMDQEKLVLALIGNSSNSFTIDDKDKLMGMSESELVGVMSQPVTEEKAKSVMNAAGFDFDGYEAFNARKPQFDEFVKAEDAKIKEVTDSIVANSDYTPEMLEGKKPDELELIQKLAVNKSTDRLAPGQAPQGGDLAVNLD
jgi:hypothetical protein